MNKLLQIIYEDNQGQIKQRDIWIVLTGEMKGSHDIFFVT